MLPVISERLQLKLLLKQQQQEEQQRKQSIEAEQTQIDNVTKKARIKPRAASSLSANRPTKRAKPRNDKAGSIDEPGASSAAIAVNCSTQCNQLSPNPAPDKFTSSSIHLAEKCRAEDRFILPSFSQQPTPVARVPAIDSISPPIDSGSDVGDRVEFPELSFRIGDVVRIATHKSGKKELEGGTGRVMARRWNDSRSELLYDVQYILRKKRQDNIPAQHVYAEGLSLTNDLGFQTALSVRDSEDQAVLASGNWVRRSVRHAGTDQLSRPNVQELISRLERDNPNDFDMVVLRLKNWLEADTNSQVLTRIFELVANSKVVQALYVQNMEKGMDDERLQLLVNALSRNQRIWALNVGENFRISRNGWEKFAEDLTNTGVTHIYAGSESTVYGELKVKMRDAVRDNRIKHDLHHARWNLAVIWQIGQMWWNPRNSKIVQSYKHDGRDENDDKPLFPLNAKVVFKSDEDGTFRWSYGAVVEIGEGANRFVKLNSGESVWLDLLDPKLSSSDKHELVIAEKSGKTLPAVYFAESSVFVWLNSHNGEMGFTISQEDIKPVPFFIDEELAEGKIQACHESFKCARRYYYGE